MDENKKELERFRKEVLSFHLPRWEELPDIELYMDQVVTFIENSFSIFVNQDDEKIITPSMINNYVKLNLIPKPINKKYDKVHLAYLIVISILKHVFTIQQVRDGIIFQSKLLGESHAYNSFCREQENALKFLIQGIGSSDQDFSSIFHINYEDAIIKMGTLAFASKILTSKMLIFQKN